MKKRSLVSSPRRRGADDVSGGEAFSAQPHLQFWLLGSLQVWRDKTRLDTSLPSQRLRALLALLLIERNHFVPAERLIEFLWAHLPATAAANNLQVAISQLRRWLEPALARGATSHYLLTVPGGYRLQTDDCYVDVDDFVQAIQRGGAARRAGDAPRARKSFEHARQLYRGEFLAEFPYAEWALAVRERLREAHLQSLQALAEIYAQQGMYDETVNICQQALAVDALREEFYRQLMSSYAAQGRRAQALEAYARCQTILQRELGVMLSPETTALRDTILAGTFSLPEPIADTAARSVELPFVGREKAVAQLHRAWKERGRVVLVSGPAGAGKTRLLVEFAAASGVRAVSSRARENELPFGVVLSSFAAYLDLRPSVSRLATLGTLGAPLAHVLPRLRELWRDCPPYSPLAPDAERERMHHAALTALNLAVSERALFLFDDLHWSDQASLAVLGDLLRAHSHEALLIFSYRADEATSHPALVDWLNQTRQALHPLEIELGDLGSADVLEATRRVTSLPDPTLVSQRLFQVTGGRPLFLTETVRGLIDAGWLYLDPDGAWHVSQTEHAEFAVVALSESLRETILARAARLEPAAREVLDAAAVLGAASTLRALAALLQVGEPELQRTLLNLASRRWLARAPGSPTESGIWEFSHQLIGETLYAALPLAQKRLLHRLAARVLIAENPSAPHPAADQVVEHLIAAGGESGSIARWAVFAGQWAFQNFAHVQARHYYELALTQMEHVSLAERDVSFALHAHEGLGLAQRQLGQLKPGFESLERALGVAHSAADRARLLLTLARTCEADLAEYDRAMELLDQVQALVDESNLPREEWLAQILITRASVHYWRGEHAIGERIAREGMRLAKGGPYEPLALRALANNLQKLGQIETAMELYQQILEHAQARGDLRELANAHIALGNGCQAVGQLTASLAEYEQAGELFRQLGDLRRLSVKEANFSSVSFFVGNLDRAQDSARRAIDLAESVGAPYTVAVARNFLGEILTWRGRWDDAQVEFEHAIQLAHSINAQVVEAQAHLTFSRYFWARGDHAATRTHAQTSLDLGEPLGDNFCKREARLVLGELALAEADLSAADLYATLAYRLSKEATQVLAIGRAERLLGQIGAARTERDSAAAHLAESERIFREAGAALELGVTLFWQAQLGRAVYLSKEDARTRLLEARRVFRRSSALPWLRRVNDALK